MPRDHSEESSLSEQLVGRPGGGGLGDTAQSRIHPPPQLAFYSGKQGLGPVPTLGAQRSLKRAMVKDYPPPSLSLDPRSSSKRASPFLIILLPNWMREQEEFRETPKEQETHPAPRASGSGATFKDSVVATWIPDPLGEFAKERGKRRDPISSLDRRAGPHLCLRSTERGNPCSECHLKK